MCLNAVSTPEWKDANLVFVSNAANILRSIKDLLKALQLAQAIPNNFITMATTESTPLAQLHEQVATAHKVSCKPLRIEDMATVLPYLYPLRSKWKTLGIFLYVDHSSLEAVRAENDSCDDRVSELVALWLRQITPPPTWKALADAVEHLDPSKAKEIRREHLM